MSCGDSSATMPRISHQRTRPTLLSRKRKCSDAEESDVDSQVLKRRQEFQDKACWAPISGSSDVGGETVVDSPKQEMLEEPSDKSTDSSEGMFRNEAIRVSGHCTPVEELPFSSHRALTCLPPTPVLDGRSSLPQLSWADPKQLWDLMYHKDLDSLRDRDADVLSKHPNLHARMRAILLDWLTEVCEVYKLHRETYYLSMDFLDRYLFTQKDICKQYLQLIGVTCLFIAAKIEEIYPPKLAEFAYVTDGACTEEEILEMELVILKALNWQLSPVTVISWLTIFLQLHTQGWVTASPDSFILPRYSSLGFVQTVQLIDLCSLDISSLRYSYSVLAASALYHMYNKETALKISGLQYSEIADCVQWMSAFAMTVRESMESNSSDLWQPSHPDRFSIHLDPTHKLQTHSVTLELLEKAQALHAKMPKSEESPPVIYSHGIPTPPPSHEKSAARKHCAAAQRQV